MTEQMEIRFEEDFLYRNNRNITTRYDIALTELIANAWDAGATKVNIDIPVDYHEPLIIEDNGTGIRRILKRYDKSIYHFFPHFIRVSIKYNQNEFKYDNQNSNKMVYSNLSKIQ
jgi:hypothetical protein